MFIFHVGTVSLDISFFVAFKVLFLSGISCPGFCVVSVWGSVFVPRVCKHENTDHFLDSDLHWVSSTGWISGSHRHWVPSLLQRWTFALGPVNLVWKTPLQQLKGDLFQPECQNISEEQVMNHKWTSWSYYKGELFTWNAHPEIGMTRGHPLEVRQYRAMNCSDHWVLHRWLFYLPTGRPVDPRVRAEPFFPPEQEFGQLPSQESVVAYGLKYCFLGKLVVIGAVSTVWPCHTGGIFGNDGL